MPRIMCTYRLGPPAQTYRLWVQFQRNGVVNAAHYDIPLKRAAIEASAKLTQADARSR